MKESFRYFLLRVFSYSLNHDVANIIADKAIFKPKTKEELFLAVSTYTEFKNIAIYKYDFISRWDTSLIDDMSKLFYRNNIFNEDIGDWDVSNVKCMKEMFRDTKSFNQDIGRWDVSNVTDMSGMFHNTKSFNQDIGKWNVSKVKNM